MLKIDWNKKYTTIAVYACIVVAIAVTILVVGLNIDQIWATIKRVVAVLNPLWLGIMIAYLCNPLFRLFERRVFAFTERRQRRRKLRRTLALVSTYLVVLLVIAIFFSLVVPQIAASYNDLVSRFQSYITSAINFADHFVRESPLFSDEYETISDLIDINEITAKIREMITNSGNLIKSLADNIVSYSSKLVVGAKNLLLSFILSIYLLASKEKLTAQCKKVCAAFLTPEKLSGMWDLAIFTDHTFGGFIVGKLLDSLIIGILSFIVFAIFDMPYYPLIAVIVGITNVIPFFGPFIGAIPSAFIIFIADPPKTIGFIILILLIQQLDGNVIGPKILGDSTGLSSLGVIISIIVMGGYFGLLGMFFGVPLFAVIYALIKKYIEARLSLRALPTETADYYTDPDNIPAPPKENHPSQLFSRIRHGIAQQIKKLVSRISSLRRRKK